MSIPEKNRVIIRGVAVVLCFLLLGSGNAALLAQDPAPAQGAAPAEEDAPKLSSDQLESLVAPIALYPDPLLAQTLVASTYPLELIQLQQWLAKNKDLKDKALADAVAKEPWDPAIQSMAAVPDVVKRLADDIQWTTQLGDAFLAQEGEVMEAVQRMRKKAEEKGSLKSNEHQVVETKVVEEKTVIVVQPSNPEVIYVPSYNPTVVYPPPVYPYPPVYYPPYVPGAGLVTFGVGMAMGAAIWGGSCCGCGWGGGGNNTININNNNNFNKNSNISGNRGGNNQWQHNSQHRGGAPYSNKATANKYGGSQRGGTGSTRQASTRSGTGAGASSRAGGASASSANRGGGGSRSSGGNYAGNRSVPQSSSRGGSSFSGASGGASSANRARSSSSRGASSMGSRGGGGGGRRR